MATKAYRRFVQRTEYFSLDLELCDLLVSGFRLIKDSECSVAEALGSKHGRHPILARRTNNRQSRAICSAHLKHTLHSAFVKDLFEDFSEFISNTMTRAALKGIDPARFVGEVKLDISAAEFLAAGNWDAAIKLVSDSIFRKLEHERNTRNLINKASSRLGLNLTKQKLDDAMPYLDARHILVHRDGKPDKQYTHDYPAIRLREGKIDVEFSFVIKAKDTITALAQHIDERIVAGNLVRRQDCEWGKMTA